METAEPIGALNTSLSSSESATDGCHSKSIDPVMKTSSREPNISDECDGQVEKCPTEQNGECIEGYEQQLRQGTATQSQALPCMKNELHNSPKISPQERISRENNKSHSSTQGSEVMSGPQIDMNTDYPAAAEDFPINLTQGLPKANANQTSRNPPSSHSESCHKNELEDVQPQHTITNTIVQGREENTASSPSEHGDGNTETLSDETPRSPPKNELSSESKNVSENDLHTGTCLDEEHSHRAEKSTDPMIKLELSHSQQSQARVNGDKAGSHSPAPEDTDKKKQAVLKMLNIPAENSASITDEELKILTKYMFMNPGVSEQMGSNTSPASKEASVNKTNRGRRKHAEKGTKSGHTGARGRSKSTRLSRKRAVRRQAPPVSDSGGEEEEEESGEEQPEKYSRLPLQEKLKVLKLKKQGLTNVKIAKKLGLTNSRVWRILQKKTELLTEAKHGKKKKRHRRTKKEMEASRRSETKVCDDTTSADLDIDEKLIGDVKNEEEEDDNSAEDTQQRTKGYKTRKDLTLEDRRKVIETLEASKTKVKDLARKFGVSTSSISRIKKNKEVMKLKLATGDLCGSLRRWRDCKDPELDKVLTKWYRAFEAQHSSGENGGAVSVTNTLLREKAHDLALIMGTQYFASDNWIHRWKNRHNIKSRMNLISDREIFQDMDSSIDVSVILDALGKQQFKMDEAKREALRQQKAKPEEFLICEHCGVLISSRRKRLDHQPGCPGALSRKDLTLHEKANVVRQLEVPGVTMVSLAKKYGVSTSAISRIHKSRVEILARVAEGGKSLAKRKRDRPSKEPEVERLLCDWYREQRDMGIHATGSSIRDKARDIARLLGKDFWPSESWVFRWRHRHNMTGNPSELLDDEEEDEEDEADEVSTTPDIGVLDPVTGEICIAQPSDPTAAATSDAGPTINASGAVSDPPKPKRSRLPKLIMCEKCGCVSTRKKNSRPVRIRHAKGCPDIRQRNEMTYEDRAKMVHALEEPGATLSSVARQFGVSVSSMSRIRQRKSEILSFTGSKGESKRIRSCKEPEIAEMLYQYYTEKKAEGIHINGPKLKERASMLAREMGREFKVSSGWLGRWRHRYNVFSSPKPPSEKIRDRDLSQPSKPRKKQQRKSKVSGEVDGQAIKSDIPATQIVSAEFEGDGAGLGGQIILEEPLEQVPAPMPSSAAALQPSVFLHRSFQTPWDLVTQQQQQHQQQQQQQQTVGSWVKDLMPGAITTSMGDHESVTYPYAEGPSAVLSKQLFHHHPHPSHHNMFESFPSAAVGYHVALPPGLDATGNLMSRDFLKEDGADVGVPSTVKSSNNLSSLPPGHQALSLPHPGHLPHPLLSQPQHTSLPHSSSQPPTSASSSHHHHHHHHHHQQLVQHHTRQHLPTTHHQQQQQPQPHQLQATQQQTLHLHGNSAMASSSSTPNPEEDPDQQRHLMDALKMMSSFAARKSLGDQVQSALRTIEMTMKSNPRKSSARGNYPNMQ